VSRDSHGTANECGATSAATAIYDAALAVCVEFDVLLNDQWSEGYSDLEVERLAEFREKFIQPLRAAMKEGQAHV